jgi:ketosteroid isomerase-like protein
VASDDREAALRTAIERFGEAWAHGDGATLDTMLSPTYTHVDLFGAFHDRASWLNYAAGRAGRATRIAFRDVKTRLAGDLAIVTGLNVIEGPGGHNAEDQTSHTLRFTQVWRYAEGRWLRAAFQPTPVDRTSRPES